MQQIENQTRMHAEPNTDRTSNQLATFGWGTFDAADFGTLWLAWSQDGVVCLSFGEFEPHFTTTAEQDIPDAIAKPLEGYFAGQRDQLIQIPTAPTGTPFQKRVWQALRTIPYGQVRTYGGIATDVGCPRGMRAVGAANGANPIPVIIPCHRVVQAGHCLGGYTGGLDRKRYLLKLEGARIEDGVVQPGQLSLFS